LISLKNDISLSDIHFLPIRNKSNSSFEGFSYDNSCNQSLDLVGAQVLVKSTAIDLFFCLLRHSKVSLKLMVKSSLEIKRKWQNTVGFVPDAFI